jgi:uncharacterized membrane protein
MRFALPHTLSKLMPKLMPTLVLALRCAVSAYGLLWLLAALLAPTLGALGHFAPAGWLYETLARSCHQNPSTSFWWWGYPMGVCSRCLGVYAGTSLQALWRVKLGWPYALGGLVLAVLQKLLEPSLQALWPQAYPMVISPLKFASGGLVAFIALTLVFNLLTRAVTPFIKEKPPC